MQNDTKHDPHCAIYIQDACYQHQYIRSKDVSLIVERPERLFAVKIGIAAAIAILEEKWAFMRKETDASSPLNDGTADTNDSTSADSLAERLGRIDLSSRDHLLENYNSFIRIHHSSASIDILNDPAVKFVHGDIGENAYSENLKGWIADSYDKIAKGESEIPEHLSQGDLYLCPESLNAIQGALGTVCEAVDELLSSKIDRVFVTIRPPGHHCGEDTPSGFCFVNNAAVAVVHAHLKHRINRIVIFDIDLHHGNGTQSIIWQINEEYYQATLEEGSSSQAKLQAYYGSIHDILSYPCEDGKIEMVQAASTSIHGSHGQYIENVHLKTYTTEEHFQRLYDEEYSKLFRSARLFLEETGGPGTDVLVLISCGMDACEHEYESMSRHNRKVPVSFYHRFTRDACLFADEYGQGKLISVLEGGYSDRALISGTMAHVMGLVHHMCPDTKTNTECWGTENLERLDNFSKRRRGPRKSNTVSETEPPWVNRICSLLPSLEPHGRPSVPRAPPPITTSSMTLRDRKNRATQLNAPSPMLQSHDQSPTGKQSMRKPTFKEQPTAREKRTDDNADMSSSETTKKLPRVILRLGPRPTTEEGEQ